MFVLAGCADPGRRASSSVPKPDFRGLEAGERAAGATEAPRYPAPDQPAAMMNGATISWDELRPLLAEAAGAQIVQEVALDHLLADEMRSRGLTVTADECAAERRLLTESIVRDAKAAPADAERLLESVRRSRGLGDARFQRLLERNARMRKLVSPGVEVSDAEVAQAFEMLHGEKHRIRVILTTGQAEAASVRSGLLRAAAGEWAMRTLVETPVLGVLRSHPVAIPADPPRDAATEVSERFARAAIAHSTDPSAVRGGLLDPISTADPAYPASVRNALRTMHPGQVSPVLAVDKGFALVLLEEHLPSDSAALMNESESIRAQVRSRRERQAMDDLARRLLARSGLTALDRSLEWSLNNARGAGANP